ncbi:MAG: hypothetical protein JRJ77_12825 [Deltaproteobacteria bacterium]|nr:hypothetical protein [Deltaproteobacteria bacterium]
MKTIKIAILTGIFALAILVLPLTATAVVDWTKDDANNPVLEPGGSGAWDEDIDRPAVIKDSSTYKMWYSGLNSSGTTKYKIGYAESSNGTGWTKDAGNPVLSPSTTPADWDSAHVSHCWVIKDGSTYKMWYTGTDNADEEADCQIGYATSTDGITWTKDVGNPVLLKGAADDWDADYAGWPTVIIDAGTYKMWYVGWNETGHDESIGYATSTDGITWTKYDDPSTTSNPYANSDPVIKLGHPGSWDDESIGDPTVVKEDSIYRIWIFGQGDPGPAERIGYAYSLDGINWRKYDGNPVIMEGSSGKFDEKMVWGPMVLKDVNTYKMWYVGENNSGDNAFGYATSSAYQGSQPEINQMTVMTSNCPSYMEIFLAVIPEGPSPLDINELKVEGPSSFSYTFSDWNNFNFMGRQISIYVNPQPVNSGQYTFSVKANNGQSASNSLDLTAVTIPWPMDGSSNLDRRINGNTADKVYAGNATPNFKWKPCVGTGYYYRVWVTDWRNRAVWWVSDLDIGTNTDAGYMSATVPQDILKPNTPYWWQVQVFDSNNLWSALNSSVSNEYYFYTGTKSDTGDFLDNTLGKAWFRSTRSFRTGDEAHFGAFVHNLAPWDIDTSTNKFRVDGPGTSHDYDFNPGMGSTGPGEEDNDAFTTDPFPFMYFAGKNGSPVTGTYDFYVYDKTGNSDSASKSFTIDNSVPQVTKNEMRHENVITRIDNAYLPYDDPALFWKSKGSGYWHRAMVFDWNYRRFVWASDYLNGVTVGSDMSAQVPEGTLKEHSPYRWWVEVYDSAKQNRTRSQWLSFKTGSAEEPGSFLPAIYLLLLGD